LKVKVIAWEEDLCNLILKTAKAMMMLQSSKEKSERVFETSTLAQHNNPKTV